MRGGAGQRDGDAVPGRRILVDEQDVDLSVGLLDRVDGHQMV